MSESDSANSSAGSITSSDASALVTASQEAASTNDGWADWTQAEAGSNASAAGLDLVSGDHDTGDWFPSMPADAVIAASLSGGGDSDPLVDLPPSDFVQVADALDDADTAHFVWSEPVSQDAAIAWEALHHPIDHSMPLDHIEWAFSGLLPLT